MSLVHLKRALDHEREGRRGDNITVMRILLDIVITTGYWEGGSTLGCVTERVEAHTVGPVRPGPPQGQT
jgi:hypothetical protein